MRGMKRRRGIVIVDGEVVAKVASSIIVDKNFKGLFDTFEGFGAFF